MRAQQEKIVRRLEALDFGREVIEEVERYFAGTFEASRYRHLVRVIDFIDSVLDEHADRRSGDSDISDDRRDRGLRDGR